MKHLLISMLFLGISHMSIAQINLENTYTQNVVKYAKLSETDSYYYSVDSNKLTLYELNHSIYKTVTLPFVFNASDQMLYYISETLFDADSEIEYMHVAFWVGQNGEAVAKGNLTIYDEDGSVLLKVDTILMDKFYNVAGSGSQMIVNTSEGTKMILKRTGPAPKEARVYSLGGELYESIHESSAYFGDQIEASAYPNPASSQLKLDYTLPNQAQRGTLLLYGPGGQLVRSFEVDGQFDHIILDLNDMQNGSYYYILESNGSRSKANKLILVN